VIYQGRFRRAWNTACVAGLSDWERGAESKVIWLKSKKPGSKAKARHYHGLMVHDCRRSAITNMVETRTSDKDAMATSGHPTREVFERYHITRTANLHAAVDRVERRARKLRENNGTSLVQAKAEL